MATIGGTAASREFVEDKVATALVAGTGITIVYDDAANTITLSTSAPLGTHDILSASHGDTLAAAGVRGDLIVVNATPKWSRLPKGVANDVLGMGAGGTDPGWETASGTGAPVRASSPSLTTPTIGVATATTINKVTITAPATASTLTIADGKTLTASNTLTFTGTDGSSAAFGAGGTVAYTGGTLAQFAATTSLELLGVISDETGTGALVFANTPTLVAPVLGTPTSGTLTNCTLPVGGISGLGTGVATWLATPTSANLLAAVTDETGTGVLVFGTAPTFTTSITCPLEIGGTAAGSTLTFRATSGVGAGSEAIIFQGGNNGATEWARLQAGLLLVGLASSGGANRILQVRKDWNDVTQIHAFNNTDGTVSEATFSLGVGTRGGGLRFTGAAFTPAYGEPADTLSLIVDTGTLGGISINYGNVGDLTVRRGLAAGGAGTITATFSQVGNFLLGASTAGTSAVAAVVIGNGTAPSSSPGDVVQFYAADESTGNSGLTIRSEDGSLYSFSKNIRFGGATPGTNSDNCLILSSGTAPTASFPADAVSILSKDIAVGRADFQAIGELGGITKFDSGGATGIVPLVLFTQTATVTVNTSVTETTLIGAGTGSVTLPANFLVAGKTIRIRAWGISGTDASSAGNITLKFKFGSTVIASTGAVAQSTGNTNVRVYAECDIACRTIGASGTVFAQGNARIVAASTGGDKSMTNTGTITVDTMASQAVDFTVEFSVSDAENTISITDLTVEALN